MPKEAGQEGSQVSVRYEYYRNNGYSPPEYAPTGFEQSDDGRRAHRNVPTTWNSSPPNNRVQVDREVERSGYRHRDKGSIQDPRSY